MKFEYKDNSYFEEGKVYTFKKLDGEPFRCGVVNYRNYFYTKGDELGYDESGVYKASSILVNVEETPKISLIMAVSDNNVVGKGNKLPWKLKDDLKFFKEQTIGSHLIMGYNTFKSLPSILPNRKHIVLTSKKIESTEDVLYLNNISQLFEYLNTNSVNESYLIGGANLVDKFRKKNLIGDIFITHVKSKDVDGDVKLDLDTFNLSSYEKEVITVCSKSEDNEYPFEVVKYFK